MFLGTDTSSPPPVVTFTYLQGAEVSLTEFVHHLKVYLPLFRQLSEFRFLYLARVDVHFENAKELFNSVVTIPLGSDASAELCRYFRIRKAWDLRQYYSEARKMKNVRKNLGTSTFFLGRQLASGPFWRGALNGRTQDCSDQKVEILPLGQTISGLGGEPG
jgi:hypothetical protein